ncbi:MAG TPA: class I SAM-dependent methyltransferase [Pyrinomonadaceae bacterium]|nr:class I SAM-dependent methyltransferase [Pyrinomonadaceae bacterium]
MLDPTKRFSNRVENYIKYRPSYPSDVISLLEVECGLTPASVIADVGSGTGILSGLFLKHGNRVFGVEPNREMRAAGDKLMAQYPKFSGIDATAEATTLVNASVDFITAGQSFHWFDREKARAEFVRILKPRGWVVLIWNGFRVETSPLNNAYQQLVLKYGTDYQEVRREVIGCEVESFYAPGDCKCARFEFQQVFDFEGLKGRLLSSSYAPEPAHSDYEPMLRELQEIFDANKKEGKIVFHYETELYYGQLSAK